MNRTPCVIRNDWSQVTVPSLGTWQPALSVSVVIPAFNCQESLDLVLASLSRQTYPDHLMEVIIVDDGSSPRLQLPNVAPLNTRLIWVPDYSDRWGIANAVQVGVEQSSGEIIQRLDSDMLVYPHHVEAHARWHHRASYAVTLGTKRFVDTLPGSPNWPSVDTVLSAQIGQLFNHQDSEPHGYLERMLADTDMLRSANHLVFNAHVGATVALRRDLYQAAGGMQPQLRRGSDTEFGYRLFQAGALFIPEQQAESWHLGKSSIMQRGNAVKRYSQPFVADLMAHPRWLRKVGGTAWKVPLVVVSVDADGRTLEQVRETVDNLLRSDESDLKVCLNGAWEKLADEPRTIFNDPLLDMRLLEATYRSEPRVEFVTEGPATAFPSPYLLAVKAPVAVQTATIRQLIKFADERQLGVVDVQGAEDTSLLQLWRTAAIERARWDAALDSNPHAAIAAVYGAATVSASEFGAHKIDLEEVGIDPPDHKNRARRADFSIEVTNMRSLLRAGLTVVRHTAPGEFAWRIRQRLRRSLASNGQR